ncbi:MAG: peptidoglycan-binding protein LysM [Nonlabens sp.]
MKIYLPLIALLFSYHIAIAAPATLNKILVDHQAESVATLNPAATFSYYGPSQQTESLDQILMEYSMVYVKPMGFTSFKEALGFKESQGRYGAVNTLGYMGKYQFGATTLQQLGISNFDAFLRSPRLQERVFVKNLDYNRKYLTSYIEKYNGKVIGGVTITESGILAAAHLSGAGGVRRYLRSNGHSYGSDAYGTTVKNYLKKFSGYDLDVI